MKQMKTMALNILVTEDCSAVRFMIKKALQMSEIPVDDIYEAQNGEEGLKHLKEKKIHLILLDVNMPVMDGAEMLKKLRTDREICDIPVLIISTDTNIKRIEATDSEGVGFLIKPFAPEHLRSAVLDITGVGDDE